MAKSYKEKLDGDELDLSMMRLTEIPVLEIAALPRAKKIDLSNNQINKIGANFAGELSKQIISLDLSNNRVADLPENIGNLVNLTKLDLYNNKISDLPLSFGKLSKLRWLDLKGNDDLSKELKKVAGDCLSAQECASCARNVVKYLKEKQQSIEEEAAELFRKKQEREERGRLIKEKKLAKENAKKELELEKMKKAEEKKSAMNGRAHHEEKTAEQKPLKKKQLRKLAAAKKSKLPLVNWLLFLSLLVLSSVAVYIHADGDLSCEGLEKAYPRVLANGNTLVNLVKDNLDAESLKNNSLLLYSNTLEGLARCQTIVQEQALTGYNYVCSYIDCEGIQKSVVAASTSFYNNLSKLVEEIGKNENVKAVLAALKVFFDIAMEKVGLAVSYINEKAPPAFDAVREYTSEAILVAKQSLGLIK